MLHFISTLFYSERRRKRRDNYVCIVTLSHSSVSQHIKLLKTRSSSAYNQC